MGSSRLWRWGEIAVALSERGCRPNPSTITHPQTLQFQPPRPQDSLITLRPAAHTACMRSRMLVSASCTRHRVHHRRVRTWLGSWFVACLSILTTSRLYTAAAATDPLAARKLLQQDSNNATNTTEQRIYQVVLHQLHLQDCCNYHQLMPAAQIPVFSRVDSFVLWAHRRCYRTSVSGQARVNGL